MSLFCRWYEKNMEDLTEWQQEACEENGQQCILNDGIMCQDLIEKELEEKNDEESGWGWDGDKNGD